MTDEDELPEDDAEDGAEDEVDFDEGDLPEGLEAAALATDGADADAKGEKAAAEEEEEEVPEFADLPVPAKKDLKKALDWAFEKEDDVPPEFLEACADHARMVQEANRKMNLTKIVDPKEIAAKHYLDSWRTTRLLPLLGRAVLDLGSGAGYPGIPVALAEPNARVVCIDSTKKKADFIGECIEKLGLRNAEAIWGRAEEHLLRNRFEVVLVRAVSSVRENVRTLRKVRHSLHDLVMMKGPSWSREVRAGEREAERLGFRLDTVWEHELPGEMGGRAVLVYRAPGAQGL